MKPLIHIKVKNSIIWFLIAVYALVIVVQAGIISILFHFGFNNLLAIWGLAFVFMIAFDLIILIVFVVVAIVESPLVEVMAFEDRLILSRKLNKIDRHEIYRGEIVAISMVKVNSGRRNIFSLSISSEPGWHSMVPNQFMDTIAITTTGNNFLFNCPDAVEVASRLRDIYSLSESAIEIPQKWQVGD